MLNEHMCVRTIYLFVFSHGHLSQVTNSPAWSQSFILIPGIACTHMPSTCKTLPDRGQLALTMSSDGAGVMIFGTKKKLVTSASWLLWIIVGLTNEVMIDWFQF